MFLEVSHRMSAQGGGICHLTPCILPTVVPSEVQSGRLPHQPTMLMLSQRHSEGPGLGNKW